MRAKNLKTFLELDQAEAKVVRPVVHLGVQLFANQSEEVEHHHLPDVANLVSQVCIAQHPLLIQSKHIGYHTPRSANGW